MILNLINEVLVILDKGMGLFGSIKTDKDNKKLMQILEQLSLSVEKLEDKLYYAPSVSKVLPLTGQGRIKDIGLVKSNLSSLKKLTDDNILASALYPIPEKALNALKLDPEKVFTRVEIFEKGREMKPIPGHLPVLFEREGRFWIGWLEENRAPALFGVKVGSRSALEKISTEQPRPAADPGLLLDERFHNNDNNWPVEPDKYLRVYMRKGQYVLEGLHGMGRVLWRGELPQEGNFAVQARVRYISGPKEECFGLAWYRNSEQTSIFGVSADGHYFIGHYDKTDKAARKKGWQAVVEWTYSPYVKRNGLENTLAIQKDMDALLFYVGEHLIFECAYEQLPCRRIGFFVNKGLKYGVTRARARIQ